MDSTSFFTHDPDLEPIVGLVPGDRVVFLASDDDVSTDLLQGDRGTVRALWRKDIRTGVAMNFHSVIVICVEWDGSSARPGRMLNLILGRDDFRKATLKER
jgi:hypothetical protein